MYVKKHFIACGERKDLLAWEKDHVLAVENGRI